MNSLFLILISVVWKILERMTRLEHERKSALLLKQEEENRDWTKTDKTWSTVESLEADIMWLQQSISMTCSSVLQLIDDELYPQLVAITSGEEIEKQKAHERYMKLQEQGKTEQARKELECHGSF